MLRMLISLVQLMPLITASGLLAFANSRAHAAQKECAGIFSNIERLGSQKNQPFSLKGDIFENDDQRDVQKNVRCGLMWLGDWDKGLVAESKNRSYADRFFKDFEKSIGSNPDELTQLQTIVGTLRSQATTDFYGAQKAMQQLPEETALRVMNVLGWMSKSSDKSLRINSTLFLGEAITENGSCAYFSHLLPVKDAIDSSGYRARANVLAVGATYSQRRDSKVPAPLNNMATDILTHISNSPDPGLFANTARSAKRIVAAGKQRGIETLDNEGNCTAYYKIDRFKK